MARNNPFAEEVEKLNHEQGGNDKSKGYATTNTYTSLEDELSSLMQDDDSSNDAGDEEQAQGDYSKNQTGYTHKKTAEELERDVKSIAGQYKKANENALVFEQNANFLSEKLSEQKRKSDELEYLLREAKEEVERLASHHKKSDFDKTIQDFDMGLDEDEDEELAAIINPSTFKKAIGNLSSKQIAMVLSSDEGKKQITEIVHAVMSSSQEKTLQASEQQQYMEALISVDANAFDILNNDQDFFNFLEKKPSYRAYFENFAALTPAKQMTRKNGEALGDILKDYLGHKNSGKRQVSAVPKSGSEVNYAGKKRLTTDDREAINARILDLAISGRRNTKAQEEIVRLKKQLNQ